MQNVVNIDTGNACTRGHFHSSTLRSPLLMEFQEGLCEVTGIGNDITYNICNILSGFFTVFFLVTGDITVCSRRCRHCAHEQAAHRQNAQ